VEIEEIIVDEKTGEVTITAVIEDKVLIRSQTWYEPSEYGPARCTTSFYKEDIDFDLNEREELENYLENVEWEIIDISDDYYG
jgi:hypothetical protein